MCVYFLFFFCYVIILTDDLDDDRNVQNMRQMILNRAQSACYEALNYMKTFDRYEHIWMEDEDNLYLLQANMHSCDYIDKIIKENDDANHADGIQTYSIQSQVCTLYYK